EHCAARCAAPAASPSSRTAFYARPGSSRARDSAADVAVRRNRLCRGCSQAIAECPDCGLCWDCCECWDEDDYDSDELGIDPEEDLDYASAEVEPRGHDRRE